MGLRIAQSVGRCASLLLIEMALVDDEPRSATAIAKDPTTCVIVVRQEFGERLENSDPLTRAMLKLLVKRLRKTMQGRNAIS